MESMGGFWDQVVTVWDTGVLGVSLGPIIAAVGVFLVFLAARGLFTRIVLATVKRLAKRTETPFDDLVIEALKQPLRFLFVVVGFYFSLQLTELTVETQDWTDRLLRSMIAFTIFWAIYNLVRPLSYLLGRALRRIGPSESAQETLRDFVVKLLRFLVFALGVAAVLQEWGFNVAAVLGGLGLAGMAVALGAKDMIANVFSASMIFLNNIFEKGNWIKTSSLEGVVEQIGLFTTEVRQFDKALVTVQNSHLTAEPVVNYSRMTNRRIFWKIGLEYRTSQDQLRAVVKAIHDYVNGNDDFETDPERVPTFVFVDAFAGSSIDIMLYCFTKTTDWGTWLSIKEKLAYRIKEIVEEAGAGFAFPSTSVYMETWPLGTPEAFPAGDPESDGDPESNGGEDEGAKRAGAKRDRGRDRPGAETEADEDA